MSKRLKAIYRSGTFVPQSSCDLPDGTTVDLIIQGPYLLPPEVTDPKDREQILKAMVDRMQKNPIPVDAPHFTRESLHERG